MMVKLNWVLAAAIAARGAIATTEKLSLFADLLKRQEPGSAAYNCHKACGNKSIDPNTTLCVRTRC